MIKYADQSDFRGNGLFQVTVQDYSASFHRMSQGWELEAAGHTVSTVRMQRTTDEYMLAVQLPFSIFYSLGSSYLGNGAMHSGQIFLLQLT